MAKKAMRGIRGYPLATIAFYGPTPLFTRCNADTVVNISLAVAESTTP
jgi:hypothetical protein